MRHELLIQAAIDGKAIQCRSSSWNNRQWVTFKDKRGAVAHMAAEYGSYEYRIEPEPVPDVVKYQNLYQRSGSPFRDTLDQSKTHQSAMFKGRQKIVFDGETGLVKSVELVKE